MNKLLIIAILMLSLGLTSVIYAENEWVWYADIKLGKCINVTQESMLDPEVLQAFLGNCKTEYSNDKNIMTFTCQSGESKLTMLYVKTQELCEKLIMESKTEGPATR